MIDGQTFGKLCLEAAQQVQAPIAAWQQAAAFCQMAEALARGDVVLAPKTEAGPSDHAAR